ncbi:hypothetical protein CBR_g48579 [Chara braunii]|uniref:TFIIS central domain-containing protein n=1 Tax=Chara braunii TaxID=69332 RepID=A0A388M3B9_CHABU|nr:hypothetical protein CBR_g48579 [Chara braunii]|eukprot:GBG88969.1 hypothetical protein CBR_g48579 [Chara braunii]
MAAADVATQLVEYFEKASSAANKSLEGGDGVFPPEEARACDILQAMKKIKVTADVLLQTQVGKKLRKLTKHRSSKIASKADDLLSLWKRTVELEESAKKSAGDGKSSKVNDNSKSTKGSAPLHQNADAKTKDVNNTRSKMDVDKKLKDGSRNSLPVKSATKEGHLETKAHPKAHHARGEGGGMGAANDVWTSPKAKNGSLPNAQGGKPVVKQSPGLPKPKEEKVKSKEEPPFVKEDRKPHGDPRDNSGSGGGNHVGKPLPPVGKVSCCGDATRDKMRSLLCEALVMVHTEAVNDPRLYRSDAARMAVLVEDTMFRKFGAKSRDLKDYKAKYRSISFNLKDPKNPDLRRRVLFGEITPDMLMELSAEDMASDQRKQENEEIRKKALWECERGLKATGSTDQFKCGKCGKRETTFFQMQTRSADEPMTTYVTCVNCNNHWKFC